MTTQSLFNAQCKTFAIAKELAGIYNNVAHINSSLKPPFCLRVVKQYRTPAMQAFRNEVAREMRKERLYK